MGKGDKKSKRGKINIGSSGVRRPRKKKGNKRNVAPKPEQKPIKAPVIAPVETTPVVIPSTEAAEEITVKKPAVKKPAAKKAAETAEKEDGKQPKAKKKASKPGEDLFTEPKEDTA